MVPRTFRGLFGAPSCMAAMDSLFDAARRGLVEQVKEVLQAQPELLEVHDRWGLTALHSAAVAGAGTVVALLLDLGAVARGPGGGRRGCGLETPSLSGQTALHFAAREGRREAVQELLRRRADVGRRTAHGILPLELTADPECALMIREEAARRIKVAEQDIERLQDQLCRAVEAKEPGKRRGNGRTWPKNGLFAGCKRLGN